MFVLTKNNYILATQTAAKTQIEEARQRLSDSTQGLTFDPVPHKYYYAGREVRNVSSIVEHFAPFDSMAMAKRCSVKPAHEHFGKSPEEIVALWEKKRDDAADAGTAVHSFGEACCDFLTGNEAAMDPEFRERITPDGLVAIEPKEEAIARWWAETDWTRYAVVAKETRVFNPELRYAGTFDLLLYDLVQAGFLMKDYKSNEDLYKWYKDMMLPPLNMLKRNDIGKYTIQQTCYSICLRNIGLKVVGNDLIWLKNQQYEEVNLDTRYDKVIAFAIRQMNDQQNT